MLIENWETIKKYYEAWWHCEVLDKVPLFVTAPRDDLLSREMLAGDRIWVKREEVFHKEKVIERAKKIFQATFYGGVAFLCYWLNFGPDIFSAYLGANIEFSPVFLPTSAPGVKEQPPVSWAKWKNPVLKDYSGLSLIQINDDNFYWKKTREFISCAMEQSQGTCIVGLTDIHAGMDCLAVLRGSPQQVCMDLIDNPEGVKRAMRHI